MKMAMKFRNLQICKILKTDTNRQTEFFHFLSRLCTYDSDIQNLENNFVVSKSSYLYRVNQNFLNKMFYSFQNWKYFCDIKKKFNPFVSKSTMSKYLVCWQVFWIELRRQKDQFISIREFLDSYSAKQLWLANFIVKTFCYHNNSFDIIQR